MSKKLFFVSMLFAAVMFSFTSCGDKLDPNDPNPHCFKVSTSYDDGTGTIQHDIDYYWGTDAEFQESLDGILIDGVIPVWTKVQAEDKDACDALADIKEYVDVYGLNYTGDIVVERSFFSVMAVKDAYADSDKEESCAFCVSATNPVGSFTQNDFLYDMGAVEFYYNETSYTIEEAEFTVKAINSATYAYEINGSFACADGKRYHVNIKVRLLDPNA